MYKLHNLFSNNNRHVLQVAGLLLIFELLFESYVLKINYSNYLIYLFDSQGVIFSGITIFCITISFYLFYLYIVSALSSSWIYKIFYFLFFAFTVIVEFSYQNALGRFFEWFDVQNAISTTSEQKIVSLFQYFSFAAVISCLAFLVCLVSIRRKDNNHSGRNFLLVLGMFTVFYATISQFGDIFIEKKFPTAALGYFCRTSSDFIVSDIISGGELPSIISESKLPRRILQKPLLTENYRPSNNIVFVVDESVTGNHLSLNGYERQTTPVLDQLSQKGILHNWGIATAASTCSRFSYDEIITGITPDDLPDKTEVKIHSTPTIFQYAKAMNYQTYYFDGQMEDYWGGVPDDKNYIDNWIGVNKISESTGIETWDIDNQIARQVQKIIKSSSGNFIFIFKHGSHIPYEKNFPENEAAWNPTYKSNYILHIPSSEQLSAVINSYDNSLKYNINSFFKNLVEDYSHIPNNSIIIYTGDHGQTLYTDGKAAHGGESRIEANVPLFIIGKINAKIDTDYKASHQNIYPTILDLMTYPEELRESKNVLSLLKAKSSDSKPRFFNPNLGEKIPFD